ncbi:MAG TPA: hotdog fold thioesterase [Flavobacteriales bacterium]|nr:hotdog fold thioesterase [Flavobacteriales bacterium]
MVLTPAQIVNKMMAGDTFSHWLGVEILETRLGYCKLKAQVKPEMLNGFKIAHGGISYSLSDSALAFSSNSYGKKAVSIETSISHIKQINENDVLVVEAKEVSRSNKIGVYEVSIHNQENVLVSHFKGTVYITDKDWTLH